MRKPSPLPNVEPSRRPILRTASKWHMNGSLLLAAACLGSGVAWADDARLGKLEQENEMLRKRLESLENVAKKEGILASDKTGPQPVKALSSINLSGFVQASYFYDTSDPSDNSSNGYLWNRNHGSFTINKVKLTLASDAVERSGEKFDAGYRASFIFGEDAPIVNTGGERQGLEDLREAFVEMNVPVGTGLNVKFGQLISLLNYESGDGGVANPNFSQGYQWFYTGNGPSAGVQLGYTFTEWLDAKIRLQNGMFTGAVDGNGYKTVMGSLGIKPDAKTSLSLVGFAGREGASASDWLKGGSLIGSRTLTEKYNITIAGEFDYFNQEVTGTSSSTWWSAGGWLTADLAPKVGVAFRGEYIGDGKGAGTSGLLGFPVNSGMDLYSLTFTVNWKPVPNVKIQPEVRYDHTSLSGGFDGEKSRLILGMGASYLF